MFLKMKEIGKKYGFTVLRTPNGFALYAKTTGRKSIAWLRYDENTGVLHITGNTDNCNLWFYRTRKDLTPERIQQFVADLNGIFSFDRPLKIKDLVDPEDWQEIAGIPDAYLDQRYTQQYQ